MADATTLTPEARAALDAGDIDALLALHRDRFGGYRMELDEDDDGDDEDREDHDQPDDTDESDEGDEDSDDDGNTDEDEKSLGDKGRKALDRMKAERKELRKTIRELKAQVAELRKGDDDEDADELEQARNEVKSEREKRMDAEKRLAAKAAGLPDSWAARLQGEDFEDFLEDAESLAEDLPKTTPADRKGGRGARDGHRKRKEPSLDDKIAEAQAKGDVALVRRLKAQKVHALSA